MEWGDVIVVVVVLTISIFGIFANGLIIFVFSRNAKRRKKHLFVLNLSLMNFCASVCYLAIAKRILIDGANRTRGGDDFLCKLEGLSTGFFALGSIVQLAVVSSERAFVVRYPFLARKIHLYHKIFICTCSYVIGSFLAFPPLIGWGELKLSQDAYICCFAYSHQTISNRSYFIYISCFGYVIPCAVIAVSYGIIWYTVRQASTRRRLISGGNKEEVAERKSCSRRSQANQMKEEIRLAVLMLLASAAFMLSWTPFAILAGIGQFSSHVTSTWTLSASSILAKSFVLNNALIYGFRDPTFRANLKELFCCRKIEIREEALPLEANALLDKNADTENIFENTQAEVQSGVQHELRVLET